MKVTIIRTSGKEEEFDVDPGKAFEEIEKKINAKALDTINLRRLPKYKTHVMLVDDNGHSSSKPVNLVATKLYHSICIPGTTHQIIGDVAIVNDNDWPE